MAKLLLVEDDVPEQRAIATFLVAEGKVSAPVRAFLQTGSDAAIWEGLIAPVEWDTEAEEAPEVIREIKDRLVVLGQTMGVTPDKAEDVAAHLYEIAYGTAPDQPWMLTDFETGQNTQIPRQTVSDSNGAAPNPAGGAGHPTPPRTAQETLPAERR